MRKGFHIIKTTLVLSMLVCSSAWAAKITAINFFQEGEQSHLEFILDEPDVVFNKFQVAEDKQIIIDFKNTEATDRVMRAFDTSEFSGSVIYVSAYKKPNSKQDIRVAVQLRDNVRSLIRRSGEKISLIIENRFGVFSQNTLEGESEARTKEVEQGVQNYHIPKTASVEDILENLTLAGPKKYIGKKISFNVKNVSVEDLLKMIADSSGFNIILTDDLKTLPPMTLSLTNIPWDQALDTILGLNKLVAQKNGVILTITTLEKATREKQLEAEAAKQAAVQEPLMTKIIPVSFANLASIKDILKEYSSKERGTIASDERTNSLIIKDTAGVIEKMKKVVETLDTQVPQVLIEAKIVEVLEEFAREFGLQTGVNGKYDPMGDRGNLQSKPTMGTGGYGSYMTGPGFNFSSAPGAGRNMLGLSIGRFGRFLDLNFQLQMMESESKGKIISSPRVMTQNKKPAKISSTDQVAFQTLNTGSGGTTSGWEKMDATLELQVTPQVTNEGSILLDIDMKKEDLGTRSSETIPPPKTSRVVKTSVLVDNGSTIVIGGIYAYSKRESNSGLPFLKDVPLVGWLFKTMDNPVTKKNELIMFLTPRIVNQEEAGLVEKM